MLEEGRFIDGEAKRDNNPITVLESDFDIQITAEEQRIHRPVKPRKWKSGHWFFGSRRRLIDCGISLFKCSTYRLNVSSKAFYYKPMIALYRHIRRNKLTDYSLRFIAGADCRLKNGGYAIGTESHEKLLEIGRRLDASRTRENRIMECLLGE